MSDAERVRAGKGALKSARIRVCPLFGPAHEVEIPPAEGGHGGADPVMLAELSGASSPPDPYGRAAGHVDGAASLRVGVAANESIRTGALVHVDDLFALPAGRDEATPRARGGSAGGPSARRGPGGTSG
jgi:hypothetical protein